MDVRIVLCICGAKVYMGGKHTLCPSCNREIYLNEGIAYMTDTNIPLLDWFKFHPSDLNYFESEYPKDGDRILVIYTDNNSEIMYWENRFVEDYEADWLNNIKPISFAWKIMIEKKDMIGDI